MHSEWASVSTRTPGPLSTLKTWMSPGDGTNVSGSSALMRHSMAWPVKTTSFCLNESRSPAAIRICSLTMSMPGHHLGHRVLDLEPRVRLHEVEAAVGIHQELEGAGVAVLHRLGRVDDDAAHPPADLLAERRRRRLLDQLLMAPLDGALALAEVHAGCRSDRRAPGTRCAAAIRRTSRRRRRRRRRRPPPRAAPS